MGEYIGPQRNPITVAHRALNNYDVFVNSSASYASFNFLSNADWLVSHAQGYGNFSVFEYKFPFHYHSTIILPIWRSAMAQGLVVEVLSKAQVITGNASYIESAKKLLNAFYVEADDGGVTHKTNDRGWWYELLANDQGIKPRILNGHLFALLRIYEYYNTTSDSTAKYLFDQGITTLRNNLARFDYENGTYSYYDLSPKRLPPHNYHRLVVTQLQELYEITNDPTIKQFLEKWRDFELPANIYESEICRRTMLPPVPIFKPADYGIRIGPSDNNSVNGTDTSSLYRLDFPKPERGWNFTSQILNYHALNVTLLPYSSKGIIFTINIEEIYQPIQVQVIFGSSPTVSGWANENLYVINAGLKESIIVHPLEIVGEDYLRVRSINVFLPQVSPLDKVTFGVDIR